MRWQGEVKREEFGDSFVSDDEVDKISGRVVLVLAIVSFGWGTFLWSQSFTGSVILENSVLNVNIFSAVLFIVSIVCFFIYVRKREVEKFSD